MSDTGNTSDAPAAAPEDLEQRVQALVDEIEQTAARIEQAVADNAEEPAPESEASADPSAPAEPSAPEPSAPAAPPAAEPAEPAESPVTADASEVAPSPADPIQPPDGSAAEDATAQPPEPAPGAADEPSAPAAATPLPPESLDTLDADLEADLDRLLAAEAIAAAPGDEPRGQQAEGADPELESELNELLRQGEITAPDPEAAPPREGRSALDTQLARLHDDDLKGGPDPTPAAPESEESPAVEQVAPVAAAPPASPAAVQPAAAPAPRRSLLRAALVELADFARRSGPRVAAQVEPAAYQAAVVMSKPLQERGKAKQVIGWLAIYTAFLAACVWVYVLFLRPASPEQGPEGPAIVGVE